MKLHTVSDVVALFPKDSVTPKEVEDELERHGTYRKQFGKKGRKLLTDRDIADFFERLSARRFLPPEPMHDEAGQIVFIGSPSANTDDTLVWIGWCPFGQELDLLDRVRLGVQEHVMVLAHDNASFGDVVQMKARYKDDRAYGNPYGNWFRRTDRVMSEVEKINSSYEGDID